MASLREQFLLDPEIAYLNHGGFGAVPIPVLEAREQLQRKAEANPTRTYLRELDTDLFDALSHLAPAVGATAKDLAWTTNVTFGLNLVARSLASRLGPGDEVLLTDLEYGSQKILWEWVCRQQGAICRQVPVRGTAPADLWEAIEAHLTPAVRVVLLSHISSSTALRLPVEVVGPRLRERGVVVVVDGAHAPGHIPLDLSAMGCDYYVGNLHKWFAAPRPAGFVYASTASQALLDPLVVSWGGVDRSDSLATRTHLPGTADASNWLAVPDALAFHRAHLAPARESARQLLAATAEELQQLGYERIGHQEDDLLMSGFWIPGTTDPSRLASQLLADKVEAVVTEHGGRPILRIAVAWYTTGTETERLTATCKGLV
ncbi:MAG: aminotransferase class V-fold PLP-dependent enzyme [Acidimicrobiales bacterium]